MSCINWSSTFLSVTDRVIQYVWCVNIPHFVLDIHDAWATVIRIVRNVNNEVYPPAMNNFLLPNRLIIKSRTPCRHSIPHSATLCLYLWADWLCLYSKGMLEELLSYDLFCRILVGSPWGTQFCISVWINANRLFSEHNVVQCRGPYRNLLALTVCPFIVCCWYKGKYQRCKTFLQKQNCRKMQNSPMGSWCHPLADDQNLNISSFFSISHTDMLL